MSKRSNTVMLRFDSAFAALRDGLSVAQQIGGTLWVANDETTSLERLTIQGAAPGEVVRCDEHRSFPLQEYLRLPLAKPKAEIDIEGLAYAEESRYLWVVGSHSLKRDKAEADKSAQKNIKRLSTVEPDGNRYLLARIPVVQRNGSYELTDKADERTAAQLHGNALGNDLTAEIAKDDQLKHFLRIPGKDNGFDIEGLAVVGSRLFLGLRGPVLRGWAVLLEIEPELDHGSSDTLVLKEIGPDGQRYRKHFLALNGLGVRDLCCSGDDLLVLAGPTMVLDGPVSVFRLPKGWASEKQNVVFSPPLKPVLQVPFGKADDHAEGMCLFHAEGQKDGLLIVYDSAAQSRKHDETDVAADLFNLRP